MSNSFATGHDFYIVDAAREFSRLVEIVVDQMRTRGEFESRLALDQRSGDSERPKANRFRPRKVDLHLEPTARWVRSWGAEPQQRGDLVILDVAGFTRVRRAEVVTAGLLDPETTYFASISWVVGLL